MRISTSQIYDAGSRGILGSQSGLYRIQNQILSGRKFLSAQDDPVAAAQVLLDSQALAINTQYADNQSEAMSQLSFAESQVQAVVDALQNAREQVVAAGNGTYGDADRGYVADALQSQFDLLLGLANSTDASGTYLFSGYQGDTRPFEKAADGSVSYAGDGGRRLLQVGSGRQIAVSDSGSDLFERIPAGNGSTQSIFKTLQDAITGIRAGGAGLSAAIGTGLENLDQALDKVSGIRSGIGSRMNEVEALQSVSSALDLQYQDKIANLQEIDYAAAFIEFSNQKLQLQAAQSSFAKVSGLSLFKTLQDAITGIRAGGAGLSATIGTGLENLDQALDKVSGIRSGIGSRMNEIEALQSVSSALDLQYQEKIANLQEIDYAEAFIEFSNQQLQLQAAQSSFAKVSGLSLFNYL